MPIHIEIIFPEYAMSQQIIRDFVIEHFEGYEMDEGLVYAEALDDDEALALAAEELLKNRGIPYDLKVEDDIGSNHRFYRPGQDDVIITQSWGVSSIDPIELTQLIAETSDANLRDVLMKKIRDCLASQVEPLENLVETIPLATHEDTYALIH